MNDTHKPAPPWVMPVVVAALFAFGTYAATLSFGFTYDDVPIIAQNGLIHSLGNWRAILTSLWWNDAVYRPATLMSLALDWAVSGGAPGWFHAVNVGLHVLVTVGVFALAYHAIGLRGATVAALLFAVHPVHVEAVANVVGRGEILATLGVLGSALAYRWDGQLATHSRRDRRRAVAWALTLGGALLGLAAKESAFCFPALLLVVEWLDARVAGEPVTDRTRRHGDLWVACVGLLVLWFAVWLWQVGQLRAGAIAPGLGGLGMAGRAVAMVPVVQQYARLLLFPLHLSADYSPAFFSVAPRVSQGFIVGLALLAILVALAVAVRCAVPAATAGLAWAAFALVIVCNVLVPTEILVAERTLYLPSVGVVLALGACYEWLAVRGPRAAVVAAAILVALGCARSVTRAQVWRDNDTLFASIAHDAPGSYRADWLAGMRAYQAGQRADGERLLRHAISIYGGEPGLLTDLANRLEEDGRWSDAAGLLARAYVVKPAVTLYAARAIDDNVRGGTPDSAAAVLAAAWRTDSESVPLRIARSDMAEALGRFRESATLRLDVAREAGLVWQYWLITADAAAKGGVCDVLDEAIGKLKRLRPDMPAVAAIVAGRSAVRCQS